MKSVLNLAFLHLAIRHAEPDFNRKLILDKFAEAAAHGADFVIAPEMATSGYAFDNTQHAAQFSETLHGTFVGELRCRCIRSGCWICIGIPLLNADGQSVHNSAIVIDNLGIVRIVYHKVMAESHWATPGDCNAEGVVDTPWGRIGVLVCSDTYYGLLPRIRKLQGTDLLVVPANWPSSTLDPKRLWSTHARLNGMFVAVCNRTGKDRTLDCTNAFSCCFSPDGDPLFQGQNQESTIFTMSIPLHNGRIKTPQYVPPYGDMKALNFEGHQTTRYSADEKQTNESELAVHACCGRRTCGKNPWSEASFPVSIDESGNSLLVCLGCGDDSEMPIGCRAAFKSSRMVRVRQLAHTAFSIDLLPQALDKTIAQPHNTLPLTHCVGGINIGILSHDTARYPEYLFHLAQSGCDVCVVVGEGSGHAEDILYNCVHRMVIVYSKDGKIWIAVPPNGHEAWREEMSGEDGICSVTVPFNAVRNKQWLKKVSYCMAECIKPLET